MENIVRATFKDVWKQSLSTGIDTFRLQMESLKYFLNDIGYQVAWNEQNNTWHVKHKDKKNARNPQFMSVTTAVALYNGRNIKTNGRIYEYKNFTFPSVMLIRAWGSRIVTHVSIQRRGTEFDIQNNWVSFNYNKIQDTY